MQRITARTAAAAVIGLAVVGGTAFGAARATDGSAPRAEVAQASAASPTVEITSPEAKRVLRTAPATTAYGSTSGPGIKYWSVGRLTPGATITLYAECGYTKNGKRVREATVNGPGRMDAVLTPRQGRTTLAGKVTVPKRYDKGVAELRLTCDNMGTGLIVLESPMLSD